MSLFEAQSKKTNAAIKAILTFLEALFSPVPIMARAVVGCVRVSASQVKKWARVLLNLARVAKSRLLLAAYHAWAERTLSAGGLFVHRPARAHGSHLVGLAIGIFVVLVVVAYIFPTAISAIATANTSGWFAGTGSLWVLLELFAVLAILIGMIKTVI